MRALTFRRIFIAAVGGLALTFATASGAVAGGHDGKMDIVDTAVSAGTFGTLLLPLLCAAEGARSPLRLIS
ncbi:MAG TPA: hypothetical protein DEO85_11590 [Maritimibacter sp.]|nr:hypothetical protein [Maritimibacter sp.]